MNIIINSTNPEEVLTKYLALWNFTTKRSYLSGYVCLLGGTLLVVTCIVQPFFDPAGYRKAFSPSVLIFGLCLTYMGFIALRALEKHKKYALEAVNSHIQRAREIANYQSSITITEESVKFSNFEETIQTNWSAFSSFKIEGKYILLYKQKLGASHIIDLAGMNPEDRPAFAAFLSKILKRIF